MTNEEFVEVMSSGYQTIEQLNHEMFPGDNWEVAHQRLLQLITSLDRCAAALFMAGSFGSKQMVHESWLAFQNYLLATRAAAELIPVNRTEEYQYYPARVRDRFVELSKQVGVQDANRKTN